MRHMRNLKVLALVLGVVTAFAAVPAFASAAPELQTSAGAKVAAGPASKAGARI
jgi:hypothetical protein